MKRRFQNILSKHGKKNRCFLPACVAALTIGIGTQTGCGVAKNEPVFAGQTSAVRNVQTVSPQTPGAKKPAAENANTAENTLSEDAQEVKRIAENFAEAYFSGDTNTIRNYLTNPYNRDMEVYNGLDSTGAGTISGFTLKGLTDIGKENIGSTQVISLAFKDSKHADMFLYLTIKFVKQEDGWNIQFYGLEG